MEQKASENIWNHLQEKGYIDDKGKVTDVLKHDLKDNKVDLPAEYKECVLLNVKLFDPTKIKLSKPNF